MLRHLSWAALALAAGLTTAHAADPLKFALVHGVFKASEETTPEEAIHPLEPAQRLASLQEGRIFRVEGPDAGEGLAFPALANPAGTEAASLAELGEDTFLAAVDLTGSGVSDLLYGGRNLPGWKVFTNGTRLPKPVQGFVAGLFPQGSETLANETIPADLRAFTVDQDLLAAVGDFLGNGTEQLAYTRPGLSQLWIVGAHGVMTMKADLKGIEPTAPGARSHWLFPYKANRKGQRTRLAYYRQGADHLLRLKAKGMEFLQEKVPLKGNWERLNQAELDWPIPAAAAAKAEPAEAKAEPAK